MTRIIWNQHQAINNPTGEFGFYGISNKEGRMVFQHKSDMITDMFEEDGPGWHGLNGIWSRERGRGRGNS